MKERGGRRKRALGAGEGWAPSPSDAHPSPSLGLLGPAQPGRGGLLEPGQRGDDRLAAARRDQARPRRHGRLRWLHRRRQQDRLPVGHRWRTSREHGPLRRRDWRVDLLLGHRQRRRTHGPCAASAPNAKPTANHDRRCDPTGPFLSPRACAEWDALPYAAKCQILGTIFILEVSTIPYYVMQYVPDPRHDLHPGGEHYTM